MGKVKKIKLLDNSEYDIEDASAAHIQTVTLAEWNALTPEQQASGDYVVTGVNASPLSASLIPYDNTLSGLAATTAQGAIDEIDGAIPINSDFSLSGLSDTTITTPSSGQLLSYSGSKWVNIGVEDVTSQITWNESVVTTGTGAYKVGNMVFITYMGEIKTHSANDTLFSIPLGLRPPKNWRIPFTVNASTYGNLGILTGGNCNINQISDNTQSGRIYFNVAYPIS